MGCKMKSKPKKTFPNGCVWPDAVVASKLKLKVSCKNEAFIQRNKIEIPLSVMTDNARIFFQHEKALNFSKFSTPS